MSMQPDPSSEILYADDDAGMRAVVGDLLAANGLPARVVTGGTEALDAVRQRKPSLIILDYRMGRPNGFEVCRALKSDPRTEHIPVLILTAKNATETRVAGFDAGANDYLAKPFDPRELLARVRALLRLSQQGLDRNPTSSLPGGEAIYREYRNRRAGGAPLAVCYFDLDHFKPFGDRFGFSVGDSVIRETGDAISAAAGPTDFVGHVGGDDFLLITTPEHARQAVEAAQAALARELVRYLPAEVAAAGGYRGIDRSGAESDIPVPRLTAAILHVPESDERSLSELGEVIARAKSTAKADPRGIVEVVSTDAGAAERQPRAQPSASRGKSLPGSSGSTSSRNS